MVVEILIEPNENAYDKILIEIYRRVQMNEWNKHKEFFFKISADVIDYLSQLNRGLLKYGIPESMNHTVHSIYGCPIVEIESKRNRFMLFSRQGCQHEKSEQLECEFIIKHVTYYCNDCGHIVPIITNPVQENMLCGLCDGGSVVKGVLSENDN